MIDSRAPRVSVIIPTYNSVSFLDDCLKSVIGQTYDNIEIIVIDDGSTDATLSVVELYAKSDNRIKTMTQNHAGCGAARNRAMDSARGKYLFFLDSDDYAENQLIEKAIARLERDGSDIAVFPFFRLDGRINESLVAPWGCRKDLFPGDVVTWRDNPDVLFEAFQNFAWNKVFRRDFIQHHHIRFQEISLTEDLMFTAPALVKAQAISRMDDVLVTHREPVDTSLMSGKDAHPFDFITAFKAFKRYLESNNYMEALRVGYCRWAANACLYNLHTLNEWDSFSTVYQRLLEEDADSLGLFDIGFELYLNKEVRFLLEALFEHMDVKKYLFRVFRSEQAQRDYEWFSGRILDNRLGAVQSAYYHAKNQLDQAEHRLDDIYASETWKVGRAVTALPHAIKTLATRNST